MLDYLKFNTALSGSDQNTHRVFAAFFTAHRKILRAQRCRGVVCFLPVNGIPPTAYQPVIVSHELSEDIVSSLYQQTLTRGQFTWSAYLTDCYNPRMTTAAENRVGNLDSSGLIWKRPEGPPRVWRVVDGRRKTDDGEVPRFTIQEVPKGLETEVLDFMETHFLTEEPTCVDRGILDDPLAIQEFRTMWMDLLQQGISIVALKVNSDPAAKPVMVGVNILIVLTAEEEVESDGMPELKSKSANEVIGTVMKFSEEADALKKYGADKYLAAIGLSVHPSFRGQGLGEELLRARDDIGLAYQIPISETVFTATASQILASRVGFEVLLERKYSELLNEEGKVAFPGVTVEYIKAMGKRLYG